MSKADKHCEQRKNEITMAAKELFLKVGYEKTTVEAIINVLGVSKGMFYHYYKSKEEVLLDVLDGIACEVTTDFIKIMTDENQNAKEKMESIFRHKKQYVDEIVEGQDPYGKLFWTQFYGDISRKMVDIVNPHFISLIYQGVEEGFFKVRNAKYTALVFTMLMISSASMQEQMPALFEDAKEALLSSQEIIGRILGCEFNE